MRVMKCESVHNRIAVSAGMRGRRSKMRASSIAADEICFSSRRDYKACACGMREMATDAVLCSAAVGCAKKLECGLSIGAVWGLHLAFSLPRILHLVSVSLLAFD